MYSHAFAVQVPYSGNFRGAKYFVVFVVGGLTTNILPTNEATLPPYLQSKQQPRKYYPRNVSILLNHEYFVPRKLPAIRYNYMSTSIIYVASVDTQIHACMHVQQKPCIYATLENNVWIIVKQMVPWPLLRGCFACTNCSFGTYIPCMPGRYQFPSWPFNKRGSMLGKAK